MARRRGAALLGYMQAMQHLVVLADPDGNRFLGACPSEDATMLELIRVFLDYVRSFPDERMETPPVTVARAWQQAFPCKPARGVSTK